MQAIDRYADDASSFGRKAVFRSDYHNRCNRIGQKRPVKVYQSKPIGTYT